MARRFWSDHPAGGVVNHLGLRVTSQQEDFRELKSCVSQKKKGKDGWLYFILGRLRRHIDYCYTTLAKWILHNMGPLGESCVIFCFVKTWVNKHLSIISIFYFLAYTGLQEETREPEEKPHRHRERMQTTHIHTRNCDVFSHLSEQNWAQWNEHRRGEMKGREIKPPKKKNWLNTSEWKEPYYSSQLNPAGLFALQEMDLLSLSLQE